jgi:hypothetical protein
MSHHYQPLCAPKNVGRTLIRTSSEAKVFDIKIHKMIFSFWNTIEILRCDYFTLSRCKMKKDCIVRANKASTYYVNKLTIIGDPLSYHLSPSQEKETLTDGLQCYSPRWADPSPAANQVINTYSNSLQQTLNPKL